MQTVNVMAVHLGAKLQEGDNAKALRIINYMLIPRIPKRRRNDARLSLMGALPPVVLYVSLSQ